MKAAERLHKYGTRAYAKMRGVEWSQEFHDKLCAKYGEKFADIRPVRYGVTKWEMVLTNGKDEKTVTVESALHQQPDLERDIKEAERVARGVIGESGWYPIKEKTKYLGREYVYHYEPAKTEIPKKAAEEIEEVITEKVKEAVKETLQERRTSYAKALKDVGFSAKEILEAFKEVGL